jgi:protein-disulfide isomerase
MRLIKLIFLTVFVFAAVAFSAQNYAEATSYSNFVKKVNADRQIGDPNAAVTIIAYTDFQCYWCRKFEEYDFPYIIKHYVKTGEVYVEFRDFPLTLIHKYAFKGAEYADCAALQGKYMPVRSLLYKDQDFWSSIGDIYYFLKTHAGNIINMSEEESCVKSGLPKRLIKSNIDSGTSAKVTGTPTFYIYRGLILYKKVVGYKPLPLMIKILNGALQ